MGVKDTGIGRGIFGRDNLDPVKQIAQARLRQLLFLVQQITFCDDDDLIPLTEVFDRVCGMGE